MNQKSDFANRSFSRGGSATPRSSDSEQGRPGRNIPAKGKSHFMVAGRGESALDMSSADQDGN